MIDEPIFKTYDIRGLYPSQIDEEGAYLIGKAYADFVKPGKIIVGHDVRESSIKMEKELIRGLIEQGVDVCQIGQITTDMLFFAVGKYGFDGGIAVSASHNPPGYGGFKLVREEAIPITGESGIMEIKELVKKNNFRQSAQAGKLYQKEIIADYKKFVLSFADVNKIKPAKIICNTLNGAMAPVLKEVIANLPLEIVWLDENPDPKLSKGEPNPLLPERREETVEKIKEVGAALGVSWDGDGDRCFFFDETGEFIPAPFMTALMVEYLGKTKPHSKVIIDSRIIWPIMGAAKKNNIQIDFAKSGRTYLQIALREKEAYMAAEMTAHYFYKDNYYSDNGIIPFLTVLAILSEKGEKISTLVKPYREKFFMVDEVKIETTDVESLFKKLKIFYKDGQQSDFDGLTIEYPSWRFNLRGSNTEPVAKLNIESKDENIVEEKKQEILSVINGKG